MQTEQKLTNKKGSSPFTIMGLVMSIVGLVVLTVVLGVGADVTQTMRDDYCGSGDNLSTTACEDQTDAYNASQGGLEALDNIAGWTPTLGTILVTVFVLGLLIGLFIIRLARATSTASV